MKMKRWLQQPQDAKQAKAVDEITAVLKRFGDEQSTLLDRFERISFEVQLNQAMLGRSLSDPSLAPPARRPPPRADRGPAHGGTGGGRGGPSSLRRVLKKLFRPILGKKSSGSNNAAAAEAAAAAEEADSRIPNFQYSKAFSRSLRV
ncbi:hypothetical protein BT93_A0720 [Corymbia citriodora subsp. variegata]|nr:hypothetical protein BT93_A0720 [Corymbia citriodora subsp. variegata]